MIVGNKDEILVRIGDSVKNERLRQNITQAVLAERSGVSLNAVKHLESGSGVTLGTFVLVCRILRKDSWICSFVESSSEISPVEFVENLKKRERGTRKRASRSSVQFGRKGLT